MIQIKKIDWLLIQGFVPPFVVTFFIALFVLVMQTLWLYIDEIAGKGVGFFLMMELLGYLSVSMIPLALPIAVLISSVMILGNLAERYELSSMKSAGVPLWRVMLPLMMLDFGVAVGSFYCSNNLIPISNLKFRSRLYDIRKQKPTLNLEEGIFNDDFDGYAIRIGKKGKDERTIEDVLIIDHSGTNKGRVMEIAASNGEMYVTEDERYFVMQLYDGWQYQELENNEDNTHPFLRTHFEKWRKIFDLSEFQINRTDERLFKSHQSMLTVSQLGVAIDSIDLVIANKLESVRTHQERYYQFLKPEVDSLTQDSLTKKMQESTNKTRRGPVPMKQAGLDRLDTMASLLNTFPKSRQSELHSRAKSHAQSVEGQVQSAAKSIQRRKEARVNHYFEMHSKFSFAVSCVIFLFIGAPMGAIVRKGGFGYPMIIAILFFMAFIVLNIFSKNIAERFVIPPVQAAWLPAAVFFPMGLILTYLAMNDYHQTIDLSRFKKLIKWVQKTLLRKGVRT